MRTPVKLALFAVGLLVLFGVGLGIGKLSDGPTEKASAHSHDETAAMEHATPAGLQVSQNGYTLGPVAAPAVAGRPGTLNYTILDGTGSATTGFDTLHEKQLHLIVVRSDTMEYRHVHPTMAADGTWSIDWTWPTGGTYRVFTDFDPAGDAEQVTLSRTVEVAGSYDPQPLPAPTRTAEIDGYTVRLTGDLTTAGEMLEFTVERDGRPVTDLEPYLGANGHLVALRVGDLAYLHAHPEEAEGDAITFHVQAPTAGQYRLYLDFKHEGVVRTAEFTVDAGNVQAATNGHSGGHG
ncbi:hypothetical protein [Antrihabitans sp. YC2-6]|uniref:hypothetical protein n=1 Tax=Antrihabitans sp. YC2-6 TaxID=2799498 RepID=UPI0018F5C065|nr:hypothetical protein [Antrihabitans sp. YC2-6]MBJ8344057.1 hypothetical protein [Antrihabitans sp. YC2-6]